MKVTSQEMQHPIYKISSFKIIAPYTLELKFNDGICKVINFEKTLTGEMYSPLKDLKIFNMVSIDKEVYTIVWPNGADFDPAIIHDWDKYKNEIEGRAEEW